MSKNNPGNFFEDFRIGQEIRHATPRTVSEGDVAAYIALYGSRFVLPCAASFAQALGLKRAPIDDLLVFHIVFGKTVPDISLNAIANLGYADCIFGAPVYPGDTLSANSTVIGLRENSNKQSGVVYVRSVGRNQHGDVVLDYVRWVMVRKRDPAAPAPAGDAAKPPQVVAPDRLQVPAGLDVTAYDFTLAGSAHRWGDYAIGEQIDHVDGTTIEEAEHALATRLYQNTARVHFNQHTESKGRFGKRLIYGGHIISLARALSFNGLANGFKIAAINGGSHVAPAFAGDTVYAWSQVLDRQLIAGHDKLGGLRLRTIAAKDHACADFPGKTSDGKYHSAVLLDLDYWVLMPR
jgi:2-methylfumaryl-CoA hydratase